MKLANPFGGQTKRVGSDGNEYTMYSCVNCGRNLGDHLDWYGASESGRCISCQLKHLEERIVRLENPPKTWPCPKHKLRYTTYCPECWKETTRA